MSKCFNPLPRILEERETNGEPQLPQIRKVSWTGNKVSKEWLKRISAEFAVKPGMDLIDSVVVPAIRPKPFKPWNISSYYRVCFNDVRSVSSVEGLNGCVNEGSSSKKWLTTNSSLSATEETLRRKPDSTYISLISGIANSASVSPQKLSGHFCKETNVIGREKCYLLEMHHVQRLDEH